MNCREWEERIALYAGGDLDAEGRSGVERHLAGCTACREFEAGVAECVEWLQEARYDEVTAAHCAAVRARVLARLQPGPRRVYIWWFAAACACIAALLAATGIARWGRPDLTPPHVAIARPPAPVPAATPARPPAARPVRHARPPRPKEPLVVRIETDNPDVVIYWVAN